MNISISKYIAAICILSIAACKPSSKLASDIPTINLDTINIDVKPELEIYRASETRVNDIIHTKLEVSFDWDSTFLFGRANLTVKPHFFATDSLILDAKGFKINEVALVDKIGKKTNLEYVYDDKLELKIQLGKSYTRDDTFEVFIDYVAMPNKLKEGGSSAITSDKGLYFINPDGSNKNKPKQIWTQGETEASSCWFPTIDSPNERTSQELYITVDSSYKTLSNGTLMFQTENGDGTRTDFWKQEKAHAPYLFMMAIGDFAIVKDSWRGKQVNYYVEPKYKAFAKDIYPNTPEMLEFFSTKLGYEYPWDKFDQIVVRDYVSGAMENTSAVIYGEFIQGNDRFLIDNSGEDIVAHELFHHWFGDLVTCESWSNLPLNESFATYGEYLWNEYKYGKDEADFKGNSDLRIYLQQSRVEKKDMIRFYYEEKEDMFDSHSYQKGGRILHMLRNYVGDEAFFASLNLYLNTNKYTAVEMHQLRLAFEKVTGEDLNWFFNQWFYSAGHAELEVSRKFVESDNRLEVIVSQKQDDEKTPKVYKIPTELEIVKANGEKLIQPITINKRIDTFYVKLSAKPQFVKLDAENVLVGTINQDIDKEEAIALYHKGGNYLDRYNAIDLIAKKKDSVYLDLIEIALNDKFWAIRRFAVRNVKKLAKYRKEETFKTLKNLASDDEKSNVRAAAISALSKYYEEEIDIAFLKGAMEDKSYVVVSAGLDAIIELDEKEGFKLAEGLEKEESSSLQSTIGEIYADFGGEEKNGYFKNQLEQTSGFGKYPLIINYTDFIRNQEDAFIEKSLPSVTKLAEDEGIWFVRMAAVNGLVNIKKDYLERKEEVEELMEKTEDTSKVSEEIASSQKMIDTVVSKLKELSKTETNENLLRIIKAGIK